MEIRLSACSRSGPPRPSSPRRVRLSPARSVLLLALALLAGTSCARRQAAPVRVLAAASLVDLLSEMRPPGLEVACSFGASAQVRTQVEHGAPADLFVSASAEDVRELRARSLIQAGSERVLYRNHLVVVAPTNGTVQSLDDLRTHGRVGIGDPRVVPAGRYAEQSFRKLGMWAALEGRRVVGADVRIVLGWAASGEVDAAVVYASDARAESGRVREIAALPDDLHSPILYVAAIPSQAENSEGAKALLRFLDGAEGRAAASARGFEPVMEALP